MAKRFEVLDSFRGIAALMVALYHLHVLGIITDLHLVRNSYLFVDFFFVLSGFIICHGYQSKVNHLGDLKKFMIKRFARLWPLHIFVTVLFIPFALANIILSIDLGDRFSFLSFLTNILLVQALHINDGNTWNIPAWSISVEFYTYLAFGVFCMITQVSKRVIYSTIISIISITIVFNFSNMGDTTNLAFFRCAYSFFLGVIAYRCYSLWKAKPWMEPALIIALLITLCSFRIEENNTAAFLIPLVFFVTIIVFAQEKGSISKKLINPHLKNLGTLSFSIYLTHTWFIACIKAISQVTSKLFDYQFVYMIDGRRTIDFDIGYFNDFIYIPYLITVLFFSYLAYNYIEKPCQRKINSLSSKTHNETHLSANKL